MSTRTGWNASRTAGILDRGIEFLPTGEELAERRRNQQGLSSPELSTLMSYTKIMLAREVLSSDLPDDPDLADRLVRYFPTPLRSRYADQIREHRLSREIITTVLVNDFVNKAGITSYHRLSSETGASVADLIRANVAARLIFGAADSEAAIVALDHQVSAAVQTDQRLEVRTLVERATRWLVNNRRRPIDISADRRLLRQAGGRPAGGAARPAVRPGRRGYAKALKGYTDKGVPAELASRIAVQPYPFPALTIVQTAAQGGFDVEDVASVHFSLGQRLGPGPAAPPDHRAAAQRPLGDHGPRRPARRPARRAGLTSRRWRWTSATTGSTKQRISAWEKATPGVSESIKTLRSICDGKPDLAKASVGLRVARAAAAAELRVVWRAEAGVELWGCRRPARAW